MARRRKSDRIIDISGRLGAGSVLDGLADLFARRDGNLNDAEEMLLEGLERVGEEDLVQELCRRMRTLEPEEDSTPMIWALEVIGSETVILHLREMVQTPHLPPRAHLEAGMVLNALGESVDMGALSPPAPGDLQTMLEETEREVNQASAGERAFTINDLLDQIGRDMGREGASEMLQVLVATLKGEQRPIAVDIVWTLQEFGPDDEVRRLAGEALKEMRQHGLEPTPEMVAGTYGGGFGQAYVSSMGEGAPQDQLFVVWEQQPDALLVFSFMFDRAFWGGAIKDFFVRPGMTQEMIADMLDQSGSFGIPMVEIGEAQARQAVLEALQTNLRKVRPLPPEYRRYHRLVDRTIFQATGPVALPSPEEETRSPLPGKAGRVERLLQRRMPQAGYTPEQVRNGRMLWRDFYETHPPNIQKAEVWAATIEYVIGCLEWRRDQTQQVVAKRYGVSAGSVSKRSGELWNTFLDVEQGTIAYRTDKSQPDDMPDLMDLIGDLLEGGLPVEDDEEQELDYQDYLEEYNDSDGSVPKLTPDAFTSLIEEFYALADRKAAGRLSRSQEKRLKEIERLLLLEE